jgi:hypothetical protein
MSRRESLTHSPLKSGTLHDHLLKRLPMSKRVLAAIALAVGLTAVPVTMHWRGHAKTPTLAVSEACAEAGSSEGCCVSMGDLCLLGGEVLANHRPSSGGSCSVKPGF